MAYKIYIIKTDSDTKVTTFIEADFNWGCGCVDLTEAYNLIQSHGDKYVDYTILPYVYRTK